MRAEWGGLVLALALGLLPIARWLVPRPSLSAMLAREAILWLFAAAILLWPTRVEHLPVASIGLRRPSGKNVLFGILVGIVATVIMAPARSRGRRDSLSRIVDREGAAGLG